MIGMPTIQLSAGLSRMAPGSSQRQRGLQPYGFDGRGKRADKRGDDGRTGRNHRRRIWVCGGSSGESAGIIHGIAQTSTAEMSTAAKAMMRPSSTDEPMTCMAMPALVAPSAQRMSRSCERCSMPARPMLIMPMADTDNSNIAVTVTPSWRKPMTCCNHRRCRNGSMTIRCRSRRRITVDWQRCVGLFLEGLSLFGELHGTHVIEGRVEPLVVVPPDVPVDVRAQLFHARVGLATMY